MLFAIYYVVDAVTTEKDVSYPHIVFKWQILLPYDVVEDVKPQ